MAAMFGQEFDSPQLHKKPPVLKGGGLFWFYAVKDASFLVQ